MNFQQGFYHAPKYFSPFLGFFCMVMSSPVVLCYLQKTAKVRIIVFTGV
jgi:hypothetical protein